MPPPRIAIVGAPNVGKSTLFNRLIGRRRALVADFPGLTRDVIEARASLASGAVTVVDTGGLLPPGSTSLAAAVRAKVLEAARSADLLLFVVDGRRGRTPMDEELGRLFRESGVPILLIVNKVDVPDGAERVSDFARLGFEEGIAVSAEHGLGLAELHAGIERRITATPDASRDAKEIRVAIAGRPNVGKSSLLNALLREERALVSEEPGTTRDSIDAVLELSDGRRYRLVDTAGLRRRGRIERGAESLSAGAARRSVADSDVTLVLLDATEGLVAQDLHVLGLVAGGEGKGVRPAVVLLNKIDLLASKLETAEKAEKIRERIRFARFAPVIPISATTRRNLDKIFEAIDMVHRDATRFVSTGDLNDWLRAATKQHPPPLASGRPWSLVFATQTSAQPPSFMILTTRDVKPHFSYARYLENSLRERFGLDWTPIILRFQARKRR
jgi:GTP-binding protein